jgi:hypothetical protein
MQPTPRPRNKRPGEKEASLSLKRAQLPARPRAVLEALLDNASLTLEQGLTATLNEYEQQLFKLAEQARSNDQQNRCFESLREVRRGRSDLAPRFMVRLESTLAAIEKGPLRPEFARSGAKVASGDLALVESADLEESLALQETASKAEIRHSQGLFALGQRFGVLAASKAFEAEELPLGPHWLCEALRESSRCFDIQVDHRVLLYRVFDRVFMQTFGAFLDKVNQICIEQRVLPNLSFARRAAGGPAPAGAGAGAGGKAAGPKPPATPAAPEAPPPSADNAISGMPAFGAPGYYGAGPGAPAATAAPRRGTGTAGPAPTPPGMHGAMPAPMPGMMSQPGMSGSQPGARFSAVEMPAIVGGDAFANPMTGWPGTPGYNSESGPDARDFELFDTMRELMAGRRHALGVPEVPQANQHEVRTEDVQSVLSALQSKPAPPIRVGGKLVPRGISHVKQDLLNQLRQITPEGKQPQLNEVDQDVIDLVGMLFEHLAKDVKPSSGVQDLMTRLQVPLLRVAIKDKSFFTRRTHPARQLLNSIAEAGLYWLDEETEDRTLVDKMRLVVDRVSSEFDGDLSVFEDLLSDLSRHLNTLAKKSEVAERRHVDAAKGRERLDLARNTASQAIGERLSRIQAPALIRTLLEQAWTDVLALTILRQGENSEVYRKRLDVADRLLEAVKTDAPLPRADEDPKVKELKQEVEAGLSQVGYHNDDVQAVVKRLFEAPTEAANEEPASLTEIAIKLKSRSRLGADQAEPEPEKKATAKPKDARPLGEEEQRVMERLRTVPFGTWFEFQINQQGEKARRKLSWFSTVTGRCLFVNQRGVRAEEKTLEQLAREIVRGTANVVEAQKETLIDRAWNAILNTLKGFAGKLPVAAENPA